MVILQFWFLDKNLQVRNSMPDIDEQQVSAYGNTYHLQLTAKQNGSRNLWLRLVKLALQYKR